MGRLAQRPITEQRGHRMKLGELIRPGKCSFHQLDSGHCSGPNQLRLCRGVKLPNRVIHPPIITAPAEHPMADA